MTEDTRTIDELCARLDELSIAWSIERNEHRTYYQSAEDYLATHPLNYDDEDITPADRARAIATDLVVEVRAYPTTPVGFVEFAASDVATALRRLVVALETGEAPT